MYSGEIRRIKTLILKVKLKGRCLKKKDGERKMFKFWTWLRESLIDFVGNAGNLGSSKTWMSLLSSHHLDHR